MIPRKTLLLVAAGLVVIVVVVGVAFATGFLSSSANNNCPPGECDEKNPPVFFTIVVRGTVENPNLGVPYATISSISAVVTASPPPGLSFQVPKRDFWTNNYVLTLDYCLTYPGGQAYCTPDARNVPPSITGSVVGGGPSGYRFDLYQTGPKGTYSVRVTVHYQATGCNILQCAKSDVQKAVQFTI